MLVLITDELVTMNLRQSSTSSRDSGEHIDPACELATSAIGTMRAQMFAYRSIPLLSTADAAFCQPDFAKYAHNLEPQEERSLEEIRKLVHQTLVDPLCPQHMAGPVPACVSHLWSETALQAISNVSHFLVNA